ncbi:MAG: hypothetical protein C7B47_15935 [Sulfobacillus thermosulfidooxidans]|uniref:Uncharacterized protein n=1 Tax=Sulfobacillus thermosulfidooxidans TaxID=28034 RepID=A0A2T2WM21_SULTH|nr:MAG: hypothetical protein C7B47_15935 [Sulfobacillus thermosulfidooxidans]
MNHLKVYRVLQQLKSHDQHVEFTLVGGTALYFIGLRTTLTDIDIFLSHPLKIDIGGKEKVDLMDPSMLNRFAAAPTEFLPWEWSFDNANGHWVDDIFVKIPDPVHLYLMKLKAAYDRLAFLEHYPDLPRPLLKEKLRRDLSDIDCLRMTFPDEIQHAALQHLTNQLAPGPRLLMQSYLLQRLPSYEEVI